MEQWHAAGNHVADLAAKAAVLADLDIVQQTLDRAAQHVLAQEDLLNVFWRFLLALSFAEYQLLQRQRPQDNLTVDGPCPTEDAAEVDCADGSFKGWLQLNDGPFAAGNLPAVPRPVLLACSWPPWFTIPLWSWLRSLEWQVVPPRARARPGITYLELLVDFVVSTGVVPPESREAAAETTVPATQWPRPVTTRAWTHVLVEAVRQYVGKVGPAAGLGPQTKQGLLAALRQSEPGPARLTLLSQVTTTTRSWGSLAGYASAWVRCAVAAIRSTVYRPMAPRFCPST